MKRNIIIIAVIALVCLSCVREKRGMLTQRGKEIHDSWQEATFDVIETDIIPAFHLDAWINATNDSVRNSIEDQYFPHNRIRQEETDVYALYNGSEKVLTINTYGKSLNDEGSQWLIAKHNPDYFEYGKLPQFYTFPQGEKLHLSKDGEQWRIQMDSTECYGSSCDLHIKSLSNDGDILFAQEIYALSGNGLYKYMSGPVFLQYNIERPILREASYGLFLYCSDGMVQLIASQQDFDNINVKAEYIGEHKVCITYRGVSEIWN
ncbi:MAG: hypothetical protein J5644_07110 [Bacteroidales bacterium]|nr:hypothetical protein [Bacteroidales bacterium]